jgi:hypothetical protein
MFILSCSSFFINDSAKYKTSLYIIQVRRLIFALFKRFLYFLSGDDFKGSLVKRKQPFDAVWGQGVGD